MPTLQSETMIRKIEGHPPRIDDFELGRVAEAYAQVFAGDPWNEATYCAVEDKFHDTTTEAGQECPSEGCVAVLTEAYPLNETKGYIGAEISKPYGSLWLVDGFDDDIAGFGWSYAFRSPDEFAEKKYHTDAMRAKVVNELGRHGVCGSFFYISEIGLIPDARYRGKKMSNVIGRQFVREAKELEMDILLRTSSESPMYFTSMHLGMEQITGRISHRGTDGEFVCTKNLVGDFVDDENAVRTLFLKKQ